MLVLPGTGAYAGSGLILQLADDDSSAEEIRIYRPFTDTPLIRPFNENPMQFSVNQSPALTPHDFGIPLTATIKSQQAPGQQTAKSRQSRWFRPGKVRYVIR